MCNLHESVELNFSVFLKKEDVKWQSEYVILAQRVVLLLIIKKKFYITIKNITQKIHRHNYYVIKILLILMYTMLIESIIYLI